MVFGLCDISGVRVPSDLSDAIGLAIAGLHQIRVAAFTGGGAAMIAALRGTFRGRTGDAVIVDAGGIGYEVILPPIVEQALGTLDERYVARPPNRLHRHPRQPDADALTVSPARKRSSSGRC